MPKEVSCRSTPPRAGTRKSPPPSRSERNTRLLPSGDQAVCSTILLFSCWELGQTPLVLAEDDSHHAAVQRALKLLPKLPEKVGLLDYDKASPAMREKLNRVEGFVTTGEPTVYLKKQGAALQQASKAPGFFDYVVAIKIWHEMAHIAGADEAEAQRQEEELWKEFIVSQKVDVRRGLAYLDLLRKRNRPDGPAAAAATRRSPPPHLIPPE